MQKLCHTIASVNTIYIKGAFDLTIIYDRIPAIVYTSPEPTDDRITARDLGIEEKYGRNAIAIQDIRDADQTSSKMLRSVTRTFRADKPKAQAHHLLKVDLLIPDGVKIVVEGNSVVTIKGFKKDSIHIVTQRGVDIKYL